MSAHTSINQFGFRRAIWRGAQLLVGSVSAALISFGLEISVATARSEIAVSEAAPKQIVDRTHKGDRQQIAPASRQDAANRPGKIGAPQAPALNLRLPVGCEPMISPLANPLLARVARRCLS